ncbi:expressed protein [Batrachochytrium dendrobatidis JAM81]|uniref:Expressed protein n=2 Tax=Batrachochytrium dendrobatidis TaxID=109871 RepID=F4NWT1_BATDJ|nr:uncharacterized protein BATDEDRAFT_34505 [Batrachochytrium dendrobatidis JAM81]EGF82542.1 expressed protein [Batrachochytrium dendrobatidis JAM81]OAJ39422.1 hypothetical protein BDEG_23271 [Batrachochytrium dendrobatidis JEL423]|eukprot:XP_006676831.1 expressed protein [Batrachochytrium dendrobatidis JAM81]
MSSFLPQNNSTQQSLPDVLINGDTTTVVVEQLIIAIGLTIQVCNTIYGLRHAISMKTGFNVVLAFSMIIYSIAYIPLMLDSGLTSTSDSLLSFTDNEISIRLNTIVTLTVTHNVLYVTATFIYLLLVQLRFRVIKNIISYPAVWDTFFIVLTCLVWVCAAVVVGILGPAIWPSMISMQVHMIGLIIWSVYALFIDTVLSFTFAIKMFSARQRITNLMKSTQIKREIQTQKTTQNVMIALCVLCTVAWISFIIAAVGAIFYYHIPARRKIFYCVGFSLSSLEFSGALVFIYSVKNLFQNQSTTSFSDARKASLTSSIAESKVLELQKPYIQSRSSTNSESASSSNTISTQLNAHHSITQTCISSRTSSICTSDPLLALIDEQSKQSMYNAEPSVLSYSSKRCTHSSNSCSQCSTSPHTCSHLISVSPCALTAPPMTILSHHCSHVCHHLCTLNPPQFFVSSNPNSHSSIVNLF